MPSPDLQSSFPWLSASDTEAVVPVAPHPDRIEPVSGDPSQPIPLRNPVSVHLVDEGELGRGGMSSVRRVFNRHLLRHEAKKGLDPGLSANAGEVLRFLEEAQITGQLDHPNIPPIHEVGVDAQGVQYFTMKLVQGRTLDAILSDSRFSPLNDLALFHVIQVFIKVCQGLAFAHARGVIHCDLKPENIMVGSFGQVYVMDWGIARLLSRSSPGADPSVRTGVGRDHSEDRGRVMGTLAYMSPEQARGDTDAIDGRSDVFALGALLYRMLTGRPPYLAPSVEATWELAKAAAIVEPEELTGEGLRPGVPLAGLPWKLCRLAKQAMSPDRAQRPQTVMAFAEEMEDFLRGAGRYPVSTVRPGEQIVVEGDVGDTAYIIAKGRCRAFKMVGGRKVVLREMGPGDVFGETAILTSRPRTASVEAVDEVNLVAVSRSSLDRELGQTFYAGHILKELAIRFRDVDERLTGREHQTMGSRTNDLVLTYLNFHATAKELTSRVTSWSRLRSYLARRLDRTHDEVLTLALRMEHLRINESKDTATLLWTEGPLPAASPSAGSSGTREDDDDDRGWDDDLRSKKR